MASTPTKRTIAIAVDSSESSEYAFDYVEENRAAIMQVFCGPSWTNICPRWTSTWGKMGYATYLHHPENELFIIHIPEGFDISKAQKDLAKSGSLKPELEKVYSKITELEERYQHKLHQLNFRGSVLSVPSKNAGEAILETAREENAFAIVMGTRGRSKVKKVLLGSVSEYVVKNAEVPVIVVRKKPSKE